MGKRMELSHLDDIHLSFFFYLAVNKLISDQTQNIFSLISGHSSFIKYILNK